ncbi:hypothetical protein [Arthrobacter sp. NEB 688]|uniref:hypothetical protein n=1 Tax=Arthrobacter sp. NEB 688 TaxID=904039 RepID=UPI00156597F1|nr:hypothetical protein [Arthrobacter sp. NEB 688]QKE83240.1 hypothetical protein HL663_04300 [Arthrobacter sp. NEB 688]
MTSSTRSAPSRSTGLRLVGALTSATAVALVGTAALPAAAARAAGVHDDRPVVLARAADPAALPTGTSSPAATWRWDGTRWVRLP